MQALLRYAGILLPAQTHTTAIFQKALSTTFKMAMTLVAVYKTAGMKAL